jgi:hypothetical protein
MVYLDHEKQLKIILLGLQCLCLSGIRTLMYVANAITPNLAFVANLPTSFNSAPTKRHY